MDEYKLKIVNKKMETFIFEIRDMKVERQVRAKKTEDLHVEFDYKRIFLKLKNVNFGMDGTFEEVHKGWAKIRDKYDEIKGQFSFTDKKFARLFVESWCKIASLFSPNAKKNGNFPLF